MTFSLATQDLVFQQELNKIQKLFPQDLAKKKIKQKKNCRNSKATTAYHKHEIDQKSRFKQVWSGAPVSQNPDPGFHYLVLQFVLVLKQSSYVCMYTTHTHSFPQTHIHMHAHPHQKKSEASWFRMENKAQQKTAREKLEHQIQTQNGKNIIVDNFYIALLFSPKETHCASCVIGARRFILLFAQSIQLGHRLQDLSQAFFPWDCIHTEETSVYSLSWQAFHRVSAEFDSGEISGWTQSLAHNSHPLTRQPGLTVLSLACSRSVPVSLLIQYYDRP